MTVLAPGHSPSQLLRVLNRLCLPVILVCCAFACGCDAFDDDDDDSAWYDDDDDDGVPTEVTARLTVTVRDRDTGLLIEGARVRFYGDHGRESDLDLYDSYIDDYSDSDGVADVEISAILDDDDECIGLRAVASYSDWQEGESGVFKFWYPDGGTSTTTVYVDSSDTRAAAVDKALQVPSAAYPTIQSAIDAAVTGDRIEVAPGDYAECVDFGGKAIHVLSAAGAAETVITGDGSATPTVRFVNGEGPSTMLEGFTIEGEPAVEWGVGACPTLIDNTGIELD